MLNDSRLKISQYLLVFVDARMIYKMYVMLSDHKKYIVTRLPLETYMIYNCS